MKSKVAELPSFRVPVTPGKVRCVGCYEEFNQVDCFSGKLNKGVNFAERTTSELIWDPVQEIMIEDVVTKKFPIGKWVRGFICRKCASDYRTVTHTRKNGEIWYEPVVVLDPSSTLKQTLIPTQERIKREVAEDNFGFGPLEVPQVDISCFEKFGRGK